MYYEVLAITKKALIMLMKAFHIYLESCLVFLESLDK